MNRSVAAKTALALVIVLGIAGIGVLAYQAGVAQGLAHGAAGAQAFGRGARGGGFAAPLSPFARPAAGPIALAIGFGILRSLLPFLVIGLLVGLIASWLWRPRGYWDGSRVSAGAVPAGFAEWHRQLHESQLHEPTPPAAAPGDQPAQSEP